VAGVQKPQITHCKILDPSLIYGMTALSPDHKYLITGYSNGLVTVREVQNSGLGRATSRGIMLAREVTALAVSPDAQYLLTASDDGATQIWKNWTSDKPEEIARIPQSGYAMAFEPNGKSVATGVGGSADLWSLGPSEATPAFGTEDEPQTVAFGKNGYVATAIPDHTSAGQSFSIQIRDSWKKATPAEIQRTTVNIPVRSLAFIPERDALAILSDDRKLWIWDFSRAATAKKIQVSSVDQPITSYSFSRDGRFLSISFENGTAWVMKDYQAGTPTVLAQIPYDEKVYAVAFSPIGDDLATIYGRKEIRFWTGWQSGSLRQTGKPIKQKDANLLAFSPHGKYLAVGGDGDVIQVWEKWPSASPHLLKEIPQNIDSTLSLVFSPDESHLAVLTDDSNQSAKIWDLNDARRNDPVFVEEQVQTTSFTPDGKYLVFEFKRRKHAPILMKEWQSSGLVADACTRLSPEMIKKAYFTNSLGRGFLKEEDWISFVEKRLCSQP
jgi:WD40 repeat protein